MKKSKNPVGKDFYSLTVTADYFLNRRFKNSLAGEKFAFSGFRLGSLNWSFDGKFIGAVARCFGSLAALDGSLAGFNNGTKSNRDLDAETLGLLWSSIFVTLMANKIGGLQFGIYRNCQIVLAVPGCANGETVTGTQTVSFW